MTERAIIEQATRLRRQREVHLVATIVRADGLRVGARMLLTQFRWMTSSASGVSLESQLSNTGWDRTRDGEPFLMSCDAPDGDLCSAFGLDGEGPVEVLVERAGVPGRIDPLELADTCLRTQRRGAVATIIRGGKLGARIALLAGADPTGDIADPDLSAAMAADCRRAMATGESRTSRHGDVEWYVEAILPPPRLFVFGIGAALPWIVFGRMVRLPVRGIAPALLHGMAGKRMLGLAFLAVAVLGFGGLDLTLQNRLGTVLPAWSHKLAATF